jgi:hypothetical protein
MLAEKFFLVLESLIRGDRTYPRRKSPGHQHFAAHTGEAGRSEIAAPPGARAVQRTPSRERR